MTTEPRRPLKILYHHRTGSKDGQAVHIEELVAALRKLGHEVIMVEPTATRHTEFGKKSGLLAWFRRHLPKAVYELLELAYNLPAYFRLRRAYLEHRPDVLYERHNLYLLAGAWLKRRHRVPYLLEVNAPLFMERNAHGGLGLPRMAHGSEAWVWRQADYVLPVTAVLGKIVESEGVSVDKIVVIPNGINPERFEGCPALAEAKRRLGVERWLVLGFTGFVREWNGLEAIIDYLARPGRENLLLLVVGDGPARGGLESRAGALGVGDRVRFTGVVPRDHVRDWVAAFDIALQPAANEYASPLKLFEYLALGRAIVAPRQPNILEVLEDGSSAVLFDPGEDGAMERALDRAIDDTALRSRVASQAAPLVEARSYTWETNARRVSALAAQAVDTCSGSARGDQGRLADHAQRP